MSELQRVLLTGEGLEEGLRGLDGWAVEGETLARTFRFRSYAEGVLFACAVARVADGMDHHPDLKIGYQVVEVKTSTHDRGGITDWDLELARKISSL